MTRVLPAWLEPVLAFVNTVDVEAGVDELDAGPEALGGWLTTRGLLAVGTRDGSGVSLGAASPPGSGGSVSRADYRLALDLRTELRFLALVNNGGPADPGSMMRAQAVLDRFPLVATVCSSATTVFPSVAAEYPPVDTALRPQQLAPVRAALGWIVAGYARAVATGDWTRIRRCPADDCAWAFWDSSAKGTRRWCTMRVCGNRAKVRAFAARRSREGTGSASQR